MNGKLYIPKRTLLNSDIALGLKMLVADSKKIDETTDDDFVCLKTHKSKGAFTIYNFSAKGKWKDELYHLNDEVSNPMIFLSMLLQVKMLNLALYYEISNPNGSSDTGVITVVGSSIDDLKLTAAPASFATIGQM